MFCSQCGESIKENAKFCHACGTEAGKPTTETHESGEGPKQSWLHSFGVFLFIPLFAVIVISTIFTVVYTVMGI